MKKKESLIKHLSFITLFSYITTYAMSSDCVLVKLNNGTQQTINKDIAYKSNTIHTKQLCKERLSINPNLPIVLHNISPRALELFGKACTHSKKTFMSEFFTTLSEQDQKTLTSVAGKTHLDSPEITLLLTQQLPIDIHHTIATHFEKNKNKIVHYLQCAIIEKNIKQYPTLKQIDRYSNTKETDIYHPNGEISSVPDFFSSTNNVCSSSLIKKYKNSPISKEETVLATNTVTGTQHLFCPYQRFLHYAGKKIGNYHYLITSNQTNGKKNPVNDTCYIWRTQKNINNPDQIYYQQLPSSFEKITWSNNGKFIITNIPIRADQLYLFTLDPSSEKIITHEQLLETNGLECTEIIFNNSSTYLAAALYSRIADASTLVIYDTSGNIQSQLTFSGKCTSLSFNNDDTRLIGAANVERQYFKIFVINSTDPINITEIFSSQNVASGLKISSIQYSPYANNIAVAQIQNRHLLLIKESAEGIINIAYLMDQKNNNRFYQKNQSCYVFSPDGKFIFHNTHSLQPHRQDMAAVPLLVPSYFREGKVMVWDIKTKKLIAQQWSCEPVCGQAQIVLDHDKNKLATKRNDDSWLLHTLYTQDEHATINWVKNNSNLFELYALRQLYYTHKHKEIVSLDKNPILFDILENLPSSPYAIKQCIRDYLMHKEDTGLWSKAVEFVQNFWK